MSCKKHGTKSDSCGACFGEAVRAREAMVVDRLVEKHAHLLRFMPDDDALQKALREAYRFGAIA